MQNLSIKAKSHFKSSTSWVIVNNIVSLATQLSQNQNKIFPGKVIVLFSFLKVSFCLQCTKIFSDRKAKSVIQNEMTYFQIFSNVMEWVIVNNIVSQATQLSQNQNKIFLGQQALIYL